MEIINLSKLYRVRPSELVGLEEPYEKFCFDEACAFIALQIENGETPKFTKKYSSFRDLYKQFE